MKQGPHPLLERLLRKVGASAGVRPELDEWCALLELVSRTYRDADQERYTTERAMEISSREMTDLYSELQRRTEHEMTILRQSEERHRLLFDANPLPMWALDSETLAFIDVNSAMVRTYGYTRDEFLRMSITDVKPPGDHAEVRDALRTAATGMMMHVGLRRHVCKDGSLLDVDVTIHAVLMDGRRCTLGIAVDMTRARRVEEELRQAQKMEAIGRLAGGIAHDFNNILAVIQANTEFALEELADHFVSDALAEVQKAAKRAAGLTRQLLTFSRKQPRSRKPLALNASVVSVEAMFARIIGEDIATTTVVAPDLGMVEADTGEVEQVLMNLVVNARDAMPDGGRLRLETANVTLDAVQAAELGVEPGPHVMLAVTDTGCGMTPEVRARIFEPFFTTKDLERGTGLGLATVFGIVKDGGGGIGVDTAPGVGTTFRIYWPRIDAPPATTGELPIAPLRGSGTVLVVEDHEQLRPVLERYLTTWGYRVIVASNGADAIAASRAYAGEIDLLLTDLVMPGGLDGRALSEHLLLQRPGLRVVFMSGYTEHPAMRSTQIGPDDLFVHKPFSPRALSVVLARALAGRPLAA